MVPGFADMRGGHQVNWFLDGIPVVFLFIAANVAPVINRKTWKNWKSKRGDTESEYKDRKNGFFNVRGVERKHKRNNGNRPHQFPQRSLR